MAQVTTAELVARLVADTSGFVAGLRAAEGQLTSTSERMAAVGASATRLGRSLTMSVTLPIVALGGAAVMAATKYEQGINRIATLTNSSARDVENFSKTILNTSHQTGVAVGDLSQAMYILASSGLSAKQSQEALRMSAQASALGLGNTGTIADVVSSAMNAYAKSGLTARDATNSLINAVKVGKMKPEELASSLGKVIPLTAQMGISFQETVANIASLSQIGMNPMIATTSLRTSLTALLKPATYAKEELAKVGLTAEILRQSVKDHGLLPTLQTLVDKFDGNTEAVSRMFPEVRGLVGVLAWTGANAEHSAQNFDELRKNTDMLGRGFEYVSKKPGFQLRLAMNDIKLSMIKLGDAILPAAANIARGFGTMFGWIAKLPEPVLRLLSAFLALAGSLGPLIWLFGKLASSFAAVQVMITQIGEMGAASALAGNWVVALAVAMSVAIGAFTLLGGAAEDTGISVSDMAKDFIDAKGRITEAGAAAEAAALQKKHLDDNVAALDGHIRSGVTGFELYLQAILGNVNAQRELRRALLESNQVTLEGRNRGQKVTQAMKEYWIQTGQNIVRAHQFDNSQGQILVTLGNGAKLLPVVSNEAKKHAEAMGVNANAAKSGATNMQAFGTAMAGASEDLNPITKGFEVLKSNMDEVKKATDDLQAAFDSLWGKSTDYILSAMAFNTGLKTLAETIKDGKSTQEDRIKALIDERSALVEAAKGVKEKTGSDKAAYDASIMMTQSMLDAARAAGLSNEDFAAYAETLDGFPAEVATQIRLGNVDAVSAILMYLSTQIRSLPGYTGAGGSGPVDLKYNVVTSFLTGSQPMLNITDDQGHILNTLHVQGPRGPQGPAVDSRGRRTIWNEGTPSSTRAAGGIVTSREIAKIGEAGPEAIIPLGNNPAARLNASKVMADLGVGANTTTIAPSGGSVTNYYDVTINMPSGADGQAVVDAIVAWSRKNGALPVKVRS